MTAGYLVAMGAQVGAIAHLYGRGAAIATPLQASFAVSVMATFAVLGRFFGGVLIGRVPIKAFALANLFGQLLGFVMIAYAQDALHVWVGAGMFGFTVGNLLMLQPLMLAQAFGVADYPKIYLVEPGSDHTWRRQRSGAARYDCWDAWLPGRLFDVCGTLRLCVHDASCGRSGTRRRTGR